VSGISPNSRPPEDATVSAILESWLPEVFSSADKTMAGTSPRLRLSLSGPDGGEWDLQIVDDQFVAKRCTHMIGPRRDDPDIWIRQSAADFLAARSVLRIGSAEPPRRSSAELARVGRSSARSQVGLGAPPAAGMEVPGSGRA
jgi:hypothetical protein